MMVFVLNANLKRERRSKEVIYNFYTPKRKRQKKDKQSLFMQAVIEIHMCVCFASSRRQETPDTHHTKK